MSQLLIRQKGMWHFLLQHPPNISCLQILLVSSNGSSCVEPSITQHTLGVASGPSLRQKYICQALYVQAFSSQPAQLTPASLKPLFKLVFTHPLGGSSSHPAFLSLLYLIPKRFPPFLSHH